MDRNRGRSSSRLIRNQWRNNGFYVASAAVASAAIAVVVAMMAIRRMVDVIDS